MYLWAQGMNQLTPNFSVHVRDRLTSLHVEDLELDVKRNTRLRLNDVRANVLASNVVRPLGDLRAQHAGVVACEESFLISGEGVVGSGQVGAINGVTS